jgi:hypothetical protein
VRVATLSDITAAVQPRIQAFGGDEAVGSWPIVLKPCEWIPMSFLPTRSSSSRRARIGCGSCGSRLTLSDRIRKEGDGFVHEQCPADAAPGRIPQQRS